MRRKLFGKHFAIFRGPIDDADALLTVHPMRLDSVNSTTSSVAHAGHLKTSYRPSDHYRPPYAGKAVPCPRPSIFIGSCNRGDFFTTTWRTSVVDYPLRHPDGKILD